jgi:hypothetical protein
MPALNMHSSSGMGIFLLLALTTLLPSSTLATTETTINGKCTGNPPMYQGKLCATTTRYNDNSKGSCGCGSGGGFNGWTEGAYPWVKELFTAAGSRNIIGRATLGMGDDWCVPGCGSCYKLTNIGDAPVRPNPDGTKTGMGKVGTDPGKHITVMITNSCPLTGNEQWCAEEGLSNHYGFPYHFDIWNTPKFQALGWDNEIVTFERVPCTDPNTPTLDHWKTCECYGKTGNATVNIPFPDNGNSIMAAAAPASAPPSTRSADQERRPMQQTQQQQQSTPQKPQQQQQQQIQPKQNTQSTKKVEIKSQTVNAPPASFKPKAGPADYSESVREETKKKIIVSKSGKVCKPGKKMKLVKKRK